MSMNVSGRRDLGILKCINCSPFVDLSVGFAHVSWIMSRQAAKNRDAAIQHYLETHYDDFPLVRKLSPSSLDRKLTLSLIGN